MLFILMFQHIDVAQIEIEHRERKYYVSALKPIHPEYFPFSIQFAPDAYKLDETLAWLMKRKIPHHRTNYKQLTSALSKGPFYWMVKAHGISAQDGFWIRKENEEITWDEVNCFYRKFDYSIGNLIFNMEADKYTCDTPDLTTGGILPKTWRMKEDGTLWLVKYGSAPDYLEPYNEATATKIMSKICNTDFVRYELINVQGKVYSLCKGFMQPQLELVTADELARTEYKPDYLTTTMHLKERCRYFKIPNYKQFLDNMYMVDYLIGNMDRNLSNFGFLYDVALHEFVGPAPIYDNGTSFWESDFNLTADEIAIKDKQKARAMVNDTSRHFVPNLHAIHNIEQILYDSLHDIYSEQGIKYMANRIKNRIAYTEKYIERTHIHEKVQTNDITR